MPVWAAYMQNRHLSSKVRAFVDWVTELFGACPLLGGVVDQDNERCIATGHGRLKLAHQLSLA
jgi:LysR family transcriptional regulator for bpeEF and oprC